ncbi:hypothetical protein [Nocardia sp. bgisy134]|uniref:hypothetical protein n=1 Tax=Nocardia sp. bgisy134 TaxID=3413789 RepID=UPI003D745250
MTTSAQHDRQGAVADRPRVAFPLRDGSRSTSATGRAVLADAVRGVAPELAKTMASASNWRRDYVHHFASATELTARSGSAALRIARDGLTALRTRMRLATPREDLPLDTDVLSSAMPVDTTTVLGRGDTVTRLRVPYRGRLLGGTDLLDQLGRWVEAGVVEPAFAEAISAVVAEPAALRLPGRTVVLLGAAAAMGPLAHLAGWGADVVVIDVPVASVQARIEQLVREGSGRAVVPRLRTREHGGLSLGDELPETAAWLRSVLADLPGPVVAAHFYADSGTHVELTAAADLVAEDVCRARDDAALAYLATPTDSFLVPADAVRQAHARWADPRWNTLPRRALRTISGGTLFRRGFETRSRDESGVEWSVVNTLVDVQGPNYALAKRAQRWRAMVAAADGIAVSANVAPSAWTHSVTKNKALAAVFRAAHHYGVEIFHPETASALMAAKLVADLSGLTPPPAAHPEALFSHDAAHGGLWRQPFTPHSALPVAALHGMLIRP